MIATRLAKAVVLVLLVPTVAYLGLKLYMHGVANPAVVEELRALPHGPRAGRVTVIFLGEPYEPMPVNYLLTGDKVLIGADGGWWRSFLGDGARVEMLIQGYRARGHGIAVRNDPDYVDTSFKCLQRAAPRWLPDWLDAVLIEITLDSVPVGLNDPILSASRLTCMALEPPAI